MRKREDTEEGGRDDCNRYYLRRPKCRPVATKFEVVRLNSCHHALRKGARSVLSRGVWGHAPHENLEVYTF